MTAKTGMSISSPTISILAVDDHPLMLEGICGLAESQPDLRIGGRALSGAAALALLASGWKPDVAILDLFLPDMSGIDLMERIRAISPGTKMLILTTFDGDAQVMRAIKAGAQGYLLKSMVGDDIAHAIRAIHGGRRHIPADIGARLAEYVGEPALTARELDVLKLMAEGCSNAQIGDALGIGMETAKSHVANILSKLRVTDRILAVLAARRRGILVDEQGRLAGQSIR
jgi:DNA-binding NarL/FixJ family response regulator